MLHFNSKFPCAACELQTYFYTMALPYFYQPQIPAGSLSLELNEETSRHCIQVLRMQPGEKLQLTDGNGTLYTAIISKADKRNAVVQIIASAITPAPEKKVSIAISLLKNSSRFEWFLEKATELGVTEIIPLICRRTEKQQARSQRLQTILIAAMLQSQQTYLPKLQEAVAFTAVVGSSNYQQKLMAHCEPADKALLGSLLIENDVQLLIGPEGDFTQEEIALALQHKYLPVSLGTNRLRTETAGIAAAVLLTNSR